MDLITRLEEAILIAILRLEHDAYGVTINKQVSQSLKKNYSMGALYFSLDQLLRKGFVQKTTRVYYQKKGGRSRTYYSLTNRGKEALEEVRAHQKSLWDGIPEIVFNTTKSK